MSKNEIRVGIKERFYIKVFQKNKNGDYIEKCMLEIDSYDMERIIEYIEKL